MMLTPKEYAAKRRKELARQRQRRSRERRAGAACASHLKEDGGRKVTETEQA